MLVKEFTVVVLVTGMMLFLYLDFAKKLDNTAKPARGQANQNQEKRVTLDERLIMLKYLLKDHWVLQFKSFLHKKGSWMYLVRAALSKE